MPQTPTLAQVLAEGNTVPDDGAVEGPNGSLVTFAADGRIFIQSSGGAVASVNADGSIDINHGTTAAKVVLDSGGSVTVSTPGVLSLIADGGIEATAPTFTWNGTEVATVP